jgi:hypothetical protein
VKGILADVNVQGQLQHLLLIWQSAAWREVWEGLALSVYSFEELGLSRDVSDAVLWRECQQRQIVLITANRNDEGSDSLEATIRQHNTPGSLPVFTLADPERIFREPSYAGRVAETLLDYLFVIERVLGAGRLYVP